MKINKSLEAKCEIFTRRFIAYFIDCIIIVLPILFLLFLAIISRNTVLLLLILLVYFIIAFFYYVFMEYKLGYTIGKKMLDLSVLPEKGKKISFKSSLIRNLSKYLPLTQFLIMIDSIGILTTKKQQRFTDIIAKTIVVETFHSPKEKYASFGRRASAKIIDWIMYYIFLLPSLFLDAFVKNELLLLKLFWAYFLMWFISISLYEIYKIKSCGQTEGKKFMHIKVVKSTKEEISWGTSIIRWITKYFSYMVFGLGIFWVIFDKDKQTWHDKIVKTYVINLKYSK